MPDFLDKIKFSVLAVEEKVEPLSLVELLLGKQQEIYTEQVKISNNNGTPGNKVKTRRERRRQNKGARAKTRAQTMKSPSNQKVQQLRQMKKLQEKRRRELLDYQVQAGGKKSSQSSLGIGGIDQESRKKNKRKKLDKSTTEVVRKNIRPVILGMLDFKPIINETGSLTDVGNIIKFNRAVRALSIEKLSGADTSDEFISSILFLESFINHVVAKRDFFNAIPVKDNLSMYDEALSAFALDEEATCSNTELLYTFILEYASALKRCTPRLDESATRQFETGLKMIRRKTSVVEQYISALRPTARDSYSLLNRGRAEDAEIDMKCMCTLLGKEFMMSYNIARADVSADDQDPFEIYDVKLQSRLRPRSNNRYSAGGVYFSSVIDEQLRYNYPFESAELLPSRYENDSAPDYIRELYKKETPAASDGPYALTSTVFASTNEKINNLRSDVEIEEFMPAGAGAYIFNTILNDLQTSVLKDLANQADTTNSSRALFIALAGSNERQLRRLFVYLGLLQERIYPLSPDAEPTGFSALVRNSSSIRRVGVQMGRGVSSKGKVRQQHSIPEYDVEFSPVIDELGKVTSRGKSKTTTTAMEIETTRAAQAGESATLDSIVGITFEEMCEKFGDETFSLVKSKITAGDWSVYGTGETVTAISGNSIEDALLSAASEEDSIFHDMLNFVSNVDNDFLSTGHSAFDTENNLTLYSKLSVDKLCMLTAALYGRILNTVMETNESSSRFISFWSGGLVYFEGIDEKVEQITTYLSDEELDGSVLTACSSLSNVTSALREEDEFLSTFDDSLAAYFALVSDSFDEVVNTLNADADDAPGEQPLVDRIRAGLYASPDVTRLLQSFIQTYDSSSATYSDLRTKDPIAITENAAFLTSQLGAEEFITPGKLKYMVVGIPAGMLEEIKEEPIQIEDANTPTAVPSSDKFKVVLQKIDQTRPDVDYEEREYIFSRKVFFNNVQSSEEGDQTIYFNEINEDFALLQKSEESILETVEAEIVENILNDQALKFYSDLFLDLDFSEVSYPAGKSEAKHRLTGSIALPQLSKIDKTSSMFASASNIAFDSFQREITGFNFFDNTNNMLTIQSSFGDDPTAYGVYSYLNSYGDLADANTVKASVANGVIFERILCIPFDPYGFEIETQVEGDDPRAQNVANNAITEAEKEVGIGLETSQGVELVSYRVSVVIPDEEETDEL